jgi:preprotein translocase subunit SecA
MRSMYGPVCMVHGCIELSYIKSPSVAHHLRQILRQRVLAQTNQHYVLHNYFYVAVHIVHHHMSQVTESDRKTVEWT